MHCCTVSDCSLLLKHRNLWKYCVCSWYCRWHRETTNHFVAFNISLSLSRLSAMHWIDFLYLFHYIFIGHVLVAAAAAARSGHQHPQSWILFEMTLKFEAKSREYRFTFILPCNMISLCSQFNPAAWQMDHFRSFSFRFIVIVTGVLYWISNLSAFYICLVCPSSRPFIFVECVLAFLMGAALTAIQLLHSYSRHAWRIISSGICLRRRFAFSVFGFLVCIRAETDKATNPLGLFFFLLGFHNKSREAVHTHTHKRNVHYRKQMKIKDETSTSRRIVCRIMRDFITILLQIVRPWMLPKNNKDGDPNRRISGVLHGIRDKVMLY